MSSLEMEDVAMQKGVRRKREADLSTGEIDPTQVKIRKEEEEETFDEMSLLIDSDSEEESISIPPIKATNRVVFFEEFVFSRSSDVEEYKKLVQGKEPKIYEQYDIDAIQRYMQKIVDNESVGTILFDGFYL